MTEVECQVVRWVAEEPQPGLVEARMVDADGRVWSFIDKEPIFCKQLVTRSTRFPVAAIIRCEVVGHELLADGREVVESHNAELVLVGDGTDLVHAQMVLRTTDGRERLG
jgi:hypothetical protein